MNEEEISLLSANDDDQRNNSQRAREKEKIVFFAKSVRQPPLSLVERYSRVSVSSPLPDGSNKK